MIPQPAHLGRGCALAALLLGAACSPEQPAGPAQSETAAPRHVVIFLADATRADHLSAYGYARETTPNLRRRAERAVLFEHALAPAPWTLPSCTSLLTGTWPSRHGAGLFCEDNTAEHMVPTPLRSDGPATLGQILAAAGFATTALAANPMLNLGLQRGFEHFSNTPGRSATDIAAEAVERIAHWGAQRELLYLHFMDAHEPLAPDDSDLRALDHQRALPRRPQSWSDVIALGSAPPEVRADTVWLYDAGLHRIDRACEQVFAALERAGLLEQTLIIFTADHGEGLWDHEVYETWWYRRGPYAGMAHGQSFFEEQVHVPLLVWSPGLAPHPVLRRVSLVDLTPTILELLDVPVARSFQPQGISLVPALRGKATAKRALFLENIAYGAAKSGVVGPRGWKLVASRHPLEPDLVFDLSSDPGEHNPRWDAGERRAQLAALLEEHQRSSGSRRPAADLAEVDPQTLSDLSALGYLGATRLDMLRRRATVAENAQATALEVSEIPPEPAAVGAAAPRRGELRRGAARIAWEWTPGQGVSGTLRWSGPTCQPGEIAAWSPDQRAGSYLAFLSERGAEVLMLSSQGRVRRLALAREQASAPYVRVRFLPAATGTRPALAAMTDLGIDLYEPKGPGWSFARAIPIPWAREILPLSTGDDKLCALVLFSHPRPRYRRISPAEVRLTIPGGFYRRVQLRAGGALRVDVHLGSIRLDQLYAGIDSRRQTPPIEIPARAGEGTAPLPAPSAAAGLHLWWDRGLKRFQLWWLPTIVPLPSIQEIEVDLRAQEGSLEVLQEPRGRSPRPAWLLLSTEEGSWMPGRSFENPPIEAQVACPWQGPEPRLWIGGFDASAKPAVVLAAWRDERITILRRANLPCPGAQRLLSLQGEGERAVVARVETPAGERAFRLR